MKLLDILEYKVIGSAVRLDELPPQYRMLKVIGRGATTIALEKDPNTVLFFTRDEMKIQWLQKGLKLISKSTIIKPVRVHHIKGMQLESIYMAEMPFLYPLSPENRRAIIGELQVYKNEAGDIHDDMILKPPYRFDKSLFIKVLAARIAKKYPNSVIVPLLHWLGDYDPSQYEFDIALRQFKQTKDGKIILLDPIVSASLSNIFAQNNYYKNVHPKSQ